jgi:outer membrane protein
MSRTSFVRALLVLVAAAAVSLGAMATAAADTKIAVIDLRRAIADTEDGMRVQARLQELFDARNDEYEAKEKAYVDAKAEFDKLQKEKAPEEVLRKKGAALEKMIMELQSSQLTYRKELQRQENELMYPIVKTLLGIVRKVSQQDGYDMVLNKEAVPYFRPDVDITDRVIQLYNSSLAPAPAPAPKKGGKKGAAPAPAPAPAPLSPDAEPAPSSQPPKTEAPKSEAPKSEEAPKPAKGKKQK